MKVRALRSFSGSVSMSRGQEREIQDEYIVKDLLRAGYVEETEKTQTTAEKKKKSDAK